MWIRRRLDISWRDLFYGIAQCFIRRKESNCIEGIQRLWPRPENIFPCFSVRTGFDLLLDVLDVPEGSEVIITAVTLPDMVRIIEDHGLVSVPVDITPDTMGCSRESVQKVITPRSRIIVLTNLFGGRFPADDIIDTAKKEGLIVVEDLAQSFSGCIEDGHPKADVSMFSFGTIKTATALGGAVMSVRDPDIRDAMTERYSSYPYQTRRSYLLKLLKYTLLKTATYRMTFGILVVLFNLIRIDYDRCIHKWSRGFPGPGFFGKIRRKPCVPLLALLRRRLNRYDRGRLSDQRSKGERLLSILGENIECPGTKAGNHVYWVFPVCVEKPDDAVDLLRRNGFDATSRHSMYVVPVPEGNKTDAPDEAGRLLAHIVYLPFYPEIPFKEIERMGAFLK